MKADKRRLAQVNIEEPSRQELFDS